MKLCHDSSWFAMARTLIKTVLHVHEQTLLTLHHGQ